MRKNLADMTPIELARDRALAARRAGRYFGANASNARIACRRNYAKQTFLAATRPAWVKKASHDELVQLFRHLSEQHN